MRRLARERLLIVCLYAAAWLLAMFACGKLAYGGDYTLMRIYKRAYIDLNKTHKGDNKMCWAYALANAEAFATDGSEYTAQIIFNEYKELIGNKPMAIPDALAIMYRMDLHQLRCSHMIYKVTPVQKKWLGLWTVGALIKGEVPILGIEQINPMEGVAGHVLTVYGYEYIKGKLHLFWVDSDDKKRVLMKSKIYMDTKGRTRISHPTYRQYKISAVYTININRMED